MADKRVRLSSRWKAVRYDEVRVRLGCPGLQRESASVGADRRDVGLRKRVQRDSDGGIETRAVVVGVSHVGVDRARGTGMRDRGRRLASTRRCACGERSYSQGIESRATAARPAMAALGPAGTTRASRPGKTDKPAPRPECAGHVRDTLPMESGSRATAPCKIDEKLESDGIELPRGRGGMGHPRSAAGSVHSARAGVG